MFWAPARRTPRLLLSPRGLAIQTPASSLSVLGQAAASRGLFAAMQTGAASAPSSSTAAAAARRRTIAAAPICRPPTPWWWWGSCAARQRAVLSTRAAPSSAAADSAGGEEGAVTSSSSPSPSPARGRPRRRAAAATTAGAPKAAAAAAADDPPAAPAPRRRSSTTTTARRAAPAAAAAPPPSSDGDAPAAPAPAPAKKPRGPTSKRAPRSQPPTSSSSSAGEDDDGAAVPPSAAAGPQAAPQQSEDPSAPRLYIIDLLAQAHRMAHGLAPAALSTADGATRTGVAHGLAQLVLSLLRRRTRAPTHMAVVVDAPGATWRHERYPQYKAQRLPSPPGFREEVGRALELLSALGLPVLAVPGVEADDVVASLAVRALRATATPGSKGAAADAGAEAGAGAGAAASPSPPPSSSSSSSSSTARPYFADVVIVSPDKDFFQLLSLDESQRLSLLRLVKSGSDGNTASGGGVDGGRFTDAPEFLRLRPELARWGCGAWADVLALMGDASDNVPGVKGVGERTALALIGACGSVEAVLEAAKAEAEAEAAEQRQEAEEEQESEASGKRRRRKTARAAAAATASSGSSPLASVKLNRKQREVLASPEGRAAARLALELVTVQTDLRVPPLRDLGPFDDGEEGVEGGTASAAAAAAGDLREALRLRVPPDGGARLMAVFDALEMRKTAEQYSRLLQRWASEGRV